MTRAPSVRALGFRCVRAANSNTWMAMRCAVWSVDLAIPDREIGTNALVARKEQRGPEAAPNIMRFPNIEVRRIDPVQAHSEARPAGRVGEEGDTRRGRISLIDPCSTQSASSSISVASPFTMTTRAPFLLATGTIAAIG